MNAQPPQSTADASKDSPKPSLVELKGGKVVFRQKANDWTSGMSYMKALVALGEFLETQTTPLVTIPSEHYSVIAKLVHESDKSLNVLGKHIKKTLCPAAVESGNEAAKSLDAIVTLEAIDKAINSIAERRNYGIDDSPAALSIWRWEVKDHSLLQGSAANPTQRLEQRVQAKLHLKAIYDALPAEDREALLKKPSKSEPKTKASKDPSEKSETKVKVSKKDKDTNGDASTSEAQPTKEPKTPSAKQTALQAKKASAQKSAAVMKSFFKPAATKLAAPQPVASTSESDFERTFRTFTTPKNVTLAPINRFKFNTPPSRSSGSGSKPPVSEVIVLDDDGDVQMIEALPTPTPDPAILPASASAFTTSDPLQPTDPRAAIRDFISTVPPSRRVRPSLYTATNSALAASRSSSPRKSPSKASRGMGMDVDAHPQSQPQYTLKSNPGLSIRKIMQRLNEAEVNGDEKGTRLLQGVLKDRKVIRAKLLQFHENLRPPYYGTWTKTSAFVGPRTPFARDLAVFDYSYDSGDDWEEEEEGAEEILSEIDSDGEGGSLDEDDDDGFLVPDDEVESVGHASGSGLSRSPSPSAFRNMNMSAAAMAKGKRKAEAEGTTAAKKRRQIVGPLIPFAKGPCLEDDIGRCEYEPFSVFRIQLLNDSPFGLDPFSFVSSCEEEFRAFTIAQKQQDQPPQPTAGASSSAPASTARKIPDLFAVPSIPYRAPHPELGATSSTSTNSLAASASESTALGAGSKKEKSGPAFTLPTALYPDFLRAIDGSDKPKAVLIDELYKSFKDRISGGPALRKGAVEIKVSEVASKEKKVWRVRPAEWSAAGLPPPTS